MRTKIYGVIFALVSLSVVMNCAGPSNAQGPWVTIARADLDAALAAALAQSREVDFPEKTRFEALRFRHVVGLGIEGKARFYDPATGGYPPPDFPFFGSVPLGWWKVENGALNVRLATVDNIARYPGGVAPTSVEADQIRDSLGSAIGDLLSRMSFATDADPNRRWVIGSVQSLPEGLRFELRAR